MLHRLRNHLLAALSSLGGLLLGLTALLAITEMALFAFRGAAPPELGEIEALLMTWLALLGAAWGLGEGFHLGIDLVVEALPPRLKGLARLLIRLAVGLFGALLAGHSATLVSRIGNTLPATGWSASQQYVPGIVAGILVVLLAILPDGAPDKSENEPTADVEARA